MSARVEPGHDGADVAMALVNADGGRAEMSGNGIRCLAWVVAEAGIASNDELVVDLRLYVDPTLDSRIRGVGAIVSGQVILA